jgi:putative CocE/NonD family hydrolase
MHVLRNLFPFLAGVLFIAATTVSAREAKDPELATYIRAHYTKFEHRIPMRDGTRLFTTVYLPNDSSTTYPILMTRTPYSCKPYGTDRYPTSLGPTREFAEEAYIFVCQDVRGRFMSEGDFVNMRPHIADKSSANDVDESSDTYDTVEWLVDNVPNNNGRVGLWGNSYPGFFSSAGMIDSHPALKAVSPNAPIADWFWDDMHHHGAFILNLTFNFFSVFGVARLEPTSEGPERFDHGTPDGYRFFLDLGPMKNVNKRHFKGEIAFWNAVTEHPNYDEFWQARNILPHLKGITGAVMTVGGLFDAEDLYGPLKTYRAIERYNPEIFNVLVMGPWRHGAWLRSDGDALGEADFGFKTSETFRKRALLPFFRHFLKGEGEFDLPEAWVFETGANRWRSFDTWPPSNLRHESLYLHDGGRLGFEPPQIEGEAFDEFVSDPAKPVPYTTEITTDWWAEYMTEDQRFASRRPDVLVYRSQELEEDLTVAGPLTARLWVSTTGADADWIVKVIDEFPARLPGFEPDLDERDDDEPGRDEPDLGHTQRLVRGEVFRGRFRSSYERPEPFVPGEATEVTFELQDVLHTFKRGHRIMIQIQSTWFPLVDRNPQSWVPNIFEAEEDDFIKATHRVHRSSSHPTAIEITILGSKLGD